MTVRKREKIPATERKTAASPKPKLENPKKKMQSSKTKRRLIIAFLACFFGLLHSFHVAILFENDRHFSHLSTLEREMTFRSEMGLYYSYYKTIVEAPTFFQGFWQITNDNLTEYPDTINTLERFNLLPEVVIGFTYRIFNQICEVSGIEGKQCWEVVRGNGLSPVHSCVGLRQPEYFYLHFVWLCAGFTASMIFLYGVTLSESILGGILSVMCFFYNHGECTRVQWTPPLRESFAYPFCLLQMYCVTKILNANKHTHDLTQQTNSHFFQFSFVAITTSLCLLMWQFSQFLFATQVIAILLLFMTGFVSRFSAFVIFAGQAFGGTLTLFFLFGNELLFNSLLKCLLFSSLMALVLVYPAIPVKKYNFQSVITTFFALSMAAFLKMIIFRTEDDAHIANIIRSKISSYRDFHTLLYTCSAEFDFIGWEPIQKLAETFLLLLVILTTFGIFIYWVYSSRFHSIGPGVVYNYAQLGAFTIMAVMIMRLKLFFTPHLCIIVSLAASRKYFSVVEPKYHYAVLAMFVGLMKYNGISNLIEQHNILGEYSNVALEEVLTWINENTPQTAVFAGPMPITAAVLLSTRRPIVNHPHYENAQLRERTKKVYTVFSRKPVEEVFKTLTSLEVDYLILSEAWCFRQNRPGCSMTDIWDVEDPDNKEKNTSTCRQIMVGNFPFHLAFVNEEYTVLTLKLPYVELKGFNKY